MLRSTARCQPTRLPNTVIIAMATIQDRRIGASHVGFCAMEANVAFGLNNTFQMRLIEFPDVSGVCVAVLAIFVCLREGALNRCRLYALPMPFISRSLLQSKRRQK